MQGKPTQFPTNPDQTTPATPAPRKTDTLWRLAIQPTSSETRSITAPQLVEYIIDTLAPYSYAQDDFLPFIPPKRPANQDLNNLRLTVDLRSFNFSPLEFMDAVKAQPQIVSLVGLPFTFFYTPPESDKKPNAKPWLFLQVSAEQIKHLTGVTPLRTTIVHLYNNKSIHDRLHPGTPMPLRTAPRTLVSPAGSSAPLSQDSKTIIADPKTPPRPQISSEALAFSKAQLGKSSERRARAAHCLPAAEAVPTGSVFALDTTENTAAACPWT